MTTFEDLFSSKKFADKAEENMFHVMYDSYVSDLPENFYKNQFELASKYPFADYESWALFLQHSAFDTWKSKQINIIAGTQTDKALAGEGLKDKESLNLLKARQEVMDNSNINVKPTIIVIPTDLFFTENK